MTEKERQTAIEKETGGMQIAVKKLMQ